MIKKYYSELNPYKKFMPNPTVIRKKHDSIRIVSFQRELTVMFAHLGVVLAMSGWSGIN